MRRKETLLVSLAHWVAWFYQAAGKESGSKPLLWGQSQIGKTLISMCIFFPSPSTTVSDALVPLLNEVERGYWT